MKNNNNVIVKIKFKLMSKKQQNQNFNYLIYKYRDQIKLFKEIVLLKSEQVYQLVIENLWLSNNWKIQILIVIKEMRLLKQKIKIKI